MKSARASIAAAAMVFAAALCGCGGSAPAPDDPAARAELDHFFLQFRLKVQNGLADSLPRDLSRESLHWLDDMRYAARTEPKTDLELRPFHEILCILALRVERRLHPDFDDRPVGLLNMLVIQNYAVRKTLLKTDLGPAHVRGDEGEIGVSEAPDVPVFYFIREDGAWKFHLTRSFPLILQGAESIARQRKPARLDQAIFILQEFLKVEVLPEDLAR